MKALSRVEMKKTKNSLFRSLFLNAPELTHSLFSLSFPEQSALAVVQILQGSGTGATQHPMEVATKLYRCLKHGKKIKYASQKHMREATFLV